MTTIELPARTKKTGNFLTNGRVAWPIPNREIARLYRERAYRPISPWKYRRVIYVDAIELSGMLILSAVQKPPKKVSGESDKPN